jgi:hypothetical protein
MNETKKLLNDRSNYRKLSTFELWELTRYGVDVDWKELAIALGERVGTVYDEAEARFLADYECPRCEFSQ